MRAWRVTLAAAVLAALAAIVTGLFAVWDVAGHQDQWGGTAAIFAVVAFGGIFVTVAVFEP